MLRIDAYRQFKQRLFSGELKPGQFVSQRELALLIGLPLNPIREAIRQLESEQLIKIYPQKGIQIVECDPKTINDGHNYRLLLEVAAVRNFATNAPLDYVNLIRQDTEAALKAISQTPDNDDAVKSALETAWDFHEAIIDYQDNAIISHHYRLISARIRLFRSNTDEPKRYLAPSLRQHLSILDACAAAEEEAAVRLITDDIETSRAIILGLRTDYAAGQR